MARVIEFYFPQNFKPTPRWVPGRSARKGSRVPQHSSEEVSLNRSGTKDGLRGSQSGRGAAC
jgi:hypothetical protein